jgi:hypothetical protein
LGNFIHKAGNKSGVYEVLDITDNSASITFVSWKTLTFVLNALHINSTPGYSIADADACQALRLKVGHAVLVITNVTALFSTRSL